MLPYFQNCTTFKNLWDGTLPADENIVTPSRLIELSGKAFSRKRAAVRKFEDYYTHWQFDPILYSKIADVYALEKKWQSQAEINERDRQYINKCFRLFSDFSLQGGVLTDGITGLGYSIWTECGKNGAIILLNRLVSQQAGATAVLYRETARAMLMSQPNIEWINLGFGGTSVDIQNRTSYGSEIGEEIK